MHRYLSLILWENIPTFPSSPALSVSHTHTCTHLELYKISPIIICDLFFTFRHMIYQGIDAACYSWKQVPTLSVWCRYYSEPVPYSVDKPRELAWPWGTVVKEHCWPQQMKTLLLMALSYRPGGGGGGRWSKILSGNWRFRIIWVNQVRLQGLVLG